MVTKAPTPAPTPQGPEYIQTGKQIYLEICKQTNKQIYNYVLFIGTPIALKSADRNQWALCTGFKCFTNGCPGKIFKTKNVNKCPSNIFSLELVGLHSGDQSYVRNGNLVVLKRMYRGRHGTSGAKWIYCETTHCFVTDYCDNNGRFDMSHCHHQVRKVS